MKQLQLFDRPKIPAANRTRTSIEAAKRVATHAETQRQHILDAIVQAADAGLTRKERVVRTGYLLQSVCGRCNELLESRELYQTADARDGCKVLRATRHGRGE